MNVRFSRIAATAILVVAFLCSGIPAFAQGTGIITGTVVNKADGKPVIGATVFIVGTKLGGFSNQDGKYTIKNVPIGTHALKISSVGLAPYNVTDIVVTEGNATRVDVAMETNDVTTEEIVVTARVLRNNESALLGQRSKAVAMSDAIGVDRIEKTGSGDAGEAVSNITGASLVDGKYVYIRGLGDRYSNVQLNGSALPSSDPNRKAVQLDVFPTNLLDNIVTIKTFTPDKPGDFTGGSVNIGTKSFPEQFTFKLGASTTFDSQASLNDNFLTYGTGDGDWLGSDDGTRELPGSVANLAKEDFPEVNSVFSDEEGANRLDQITREFNPEMEVKTGSAPVNQSFSLAIGTNADLNGRQLGVLGSVTYKRSFSFYENGEAGRWKLTGPTALTLNREAELSDSKGTSEALMSGLATIAYMPADNHEVSSTVMLSQSGTSTARFQQGFYSTLQNPATQTFQTRTLLYNERSVLAIQGAGKHYFPELESTPIRLNWNISKTTSTQEEPDLRFFSNHFSVDEDDPTDTNFRIAATNYIAPSRYFRDLEDDILEMRSDLEMTIDTWTSKTGSVKIGGLYSSTTRDFNERRFQYNSGSQGVPYNGSPNDFVSGKNIGIIDASGTFFTMGNNIQDVSEPKNSYKGEQNVNAAYAMVDLPVTEELRFIGGARLETTDIKVFTADEDAERADIDETDILGSLNIVYALDESMNIRAAATQTLARPTFRELAPFSSFNFIGDYIETGNTELERTTVVNYDLRWEWFVRPGEILAVSGFYKDFTNPIERVILNENGEVQYQNVDKATVYGAELEARKSLDEISEMLSNFQIGMNFTLVQSRVDIEADELEVIKASDPEASDTRQMYGQSPYILNMDLSYSNLESGTNVALSYNIFGERLAAVTLGGTPDVFEQPRGMLNLTFSQNITDELVLKGSASNLLDASYEETQEYRGTSYNFQRYTLGQDFNLGISYSIQ